VLEESNLTPVERALCAAAATGRLLDCRTRRSGDDDPAQGRDWGKDRQIRTQLLRQLLTGQGRLDQTFGRPLAVRLRGAQIPGQLNLGGLTLRCPLELYDCYLGGRLGLAKTEAPGISLRGSYLRQGLSARRLQLTHDLNLTGAFRCFGTVNLRHAEIGGQLAGGGATFTNGNGMALIAEGMAVNGGLFLRGAQVTGEVQLSGAQIGGPLACEGARFTNRNGAAFTAHEVTVKGDLYLRHAQVNGKVQMIGAEIGGQLACEGARFTNRNDAALDLEAASIAKVVIMRPEHLEGEIDLTNARVGGWYDNRQTWPTVLHLKGFVYEAIDDPNITCRERLDWLRLHRDAHGQTVYLPQLYEQLAAVYRRAGDHKGARMVAITRQQVRRAHSSRRWARWPSRAWSVFLRWTIGYGYRPALVLPWLIGLFIVGWVVFDRAFPAHLHPANGGPDQPGFNPARYTLDLLLPVANLKQRDAFVPDGGVAWWAFGLSLAGWLLAAVVVAGLTGVFKRD